MLATLFFATAVTATVVLPTRQAATKILIGNDDGWAEANVRALYNAVKGAGSDAIIAAPTVNKSGRSSLSTKPEPLTEEGQYGTIPIGAPATGPDPNDDHIWYVNAYPVDGIKFGLSDLTDDLFGGDPSLIVTGPNVGSNLGPVTLFSGTVGAAIEGVLSGVPAIAFSTAGEERKSYTEIVEGDVASIYAAGSLRLINAVMAAGAPYVPANVILNVNFPVAGPGTECQSAEDFNFVLTRVYWALNVPSDVKTCNNGGVLPTELDVLNRDGCLATVSVMGTNKLDASKEAQTLVNDKLKNIFTCLA